MLTHQGTCPAGGAGYHKLVSRREKVINAHHTPRHAAPTHSGCALERTSLRKLGFVGFEGFLAIQGAYGILVLDKGMNPPPSLLGSMES